MALNIKRQSPLPESLSTELHTRLVESGQALSHDDLHTFGLSVSSEDGLLLGGCSGEIAFRSARIAELWVSPEPRGQGFGSKLLAEAEALAQTHNCIRMHLETRSEAARRLYERLGYTVFGKLSEYDGNVSFYYLEKRL